MPSPGYSGEMSGELPKVTLVPGDGVVIRTPAFFCVVAAAVPAEVLDAIADIESAVETPEGVTRRGRHLARAIAQLVASADDEVDIAFAATDRVGIAAFLNGRVFAEADGQRIEPGPGEPFDRALPWSHEGFGMYLAGAKPAEPGREQFDLVRGIVPAAGALLHVPVGLRSTQIVPDTGQQARLRSAAAGSEPAPEFKSAADTPRPAAQSGPSTGDLPATAPLPATETPSPAETPSHTEAPPADAPAADTPVHTAPWSPADLGGTEPWSPEALGGTEPWSPEDLAATEPLPGDAPAVAGPRSSEPGDAEPGDAEPGDTEPLGAKHTPPARPAPAGPGRAAPTRFDEAYIAQPGPPEPRVQRSGPSSGGVDAVTDVAHSRPMAYGIRCPQGHLNHPEARWCAECRQPLALGPGVLVKGERPPLGRLILDQGPEILLDETLVLGRLTGSGPGAQPQGAPRLVQVRDDSGLLSRKHVEFRLVEWTVQILDLHSANGTYVSTPNTVEVRLAPGRPHILIPGSRIRAGGRTVMFESAYVKA